jgi:ferredoxin-type protein NapG
MSTDRRDFLIRGTQTVAVAACGGLLWNALLSQQAAEAAAPLRPPGALPERDFAATCIKCGQCVVACPYRTLHLARPGEPAVTGTPTFVPRKVPCFMCADIPCTHACPTGALDRALPSIEQAKMGLAVVDPGSCLSWLGLRCEVCYRVCPLKGKAISIVHQPRQLSPHALFVPVIDAAACTGCGICEQRCPTEVAAIRIVDPNLVQGRVGAHYRLPERIGPAGEAAPPAAPAAAGSAAPEAAIDHLNRKVGQ